VRNKTQKTLQFFGKRFCLARNYGLSVYNAVWYAYRKFSQKV